MSATEVIEQIKKLPRDEQQKIAAFVLATEAAGTLGNANSTVSGEFKRVADEVFTINVELFQKLAK